LPQLPCFQATAGVRQMKMMGGNMDQNALLNVKQVAQYLQLKESTIYSWAQDGKIPAIKIGRTWRFRRADLESWLERHLKGEGEASE
jgi:excisionase family DNA binding protein